MKKKKLLTAMLSFVLVFSFLLSSSSMVFAEENVEDGAVIEKIEPSFFRAARRANGTPGYTAWLTKNQSAPNKHKLYGKKKCSRNN